MAPVVVRVVVVDDDERVRDAVGAVLSAEPDFELVGEAGSADEAGVVVAETGPDCVLVDVRMPGGGPAAVRAILAATDGREERVVVAISADAGLGSVLEMLEAGVSGYLVKGEIGRVLPDLVRRCSRGEVVLAAPGAKDALDALRERGARSS